MKDRWTYRLEWVRCGKPTCKSCPHGPYWYRYQHSSLGMAKQYLGKERPAEARGWEESNPDNQAAWWMDMLRKDTATVELAIRVLQLDQAEDVTRTNLRACLKRERLLHAAGRGGLESRRQAIDAAWSFLKAHYGW